eukprot:4940834-Pleurochrysis_carterae.AAC.2
MRSSHSFWCASGVSSHSCYRPMKFERPFGPLVPDLVRRDVPPEVRLDGAAVGDRDGVAQRQVEREPREHADRQRRWLGRNVDVAVERRVEVADEAVQRGAHRYAERQLFEPARPSRRSREEMAPTISKEKRRRGHAHSLQRNCGSGSWLLKCDAARKRAKVLEV